MSTAHDHNADSVDQVEAQSDDTVPPMCEDVATWVELIYAPTFPRRLNSTVRWCPQWWRHAEAIVRLSALWRSWEAARVSGDDDATVSHK